MADLFKFVTQTVENFKYKNSIYEHTIFVNQLEDDSDVIEFLCKGYNAKNVTTELYKNQINFSHFSIPTSPFSIFKYEVGNESYISFFIQDYSLNKLSEWIN